MKIQKAMVVKNNLSRGKWMTHFKVEGNGFNILLYCSHCFSKFELVRLEKEASISSDLATSSSFAVFSCSGGNW